MNNKMGETRHFSLASEVPESAAEIIHVVYQALKAKGHDPIMQLVGYIISGDPTLHNQLQQRPLADPAAGARRDPRGVRALLHHRTRALRRHGTRFFGGVRPDGLQELCFGTLTMSPLQLNMSVEQGAELLLYAYERGVRFLDTADLYGTYPHIRRALVGAPDLVISTKAYCYDRKTASAALERAFRGLDREYVDLFMLHEQESLYTLRGHQEALDYLCEQKALGRVGAVGMSTHHVAAVKAAWRFPGIQVIHPLINLGGVGIQGGTRCDMEGAIASAHRQGAGVFAMKALGGGHLIGSSREAFSYILSLPWIDAVAVGMQSFAEIDANVRALRATSACSRRCPRASGI